MISFYKNIGLYENTHFNSEMNITDFVESLKKITHKTNTSFISFIPDNGIPTRFEYRGIVNNDNFTIKRRLHFFDFNILHSIIKGNITEENDRIDIRIQFIPFIPHFIAFIFVFLFSLFIVIQILKDENNYFIIIIPAIIATVQYFVLKRSLKRDKYDFIRELNLISTKNNQFKKFK